MLGLRLKFPFLHPERQRFQLGIIATVNDYLLFVKLFYFSLKSISRGIFLAIILVRAKSSM